MIINADCTILTRSIDQNRKYSWHKSVYKGVYFEFQRQSTTDTSPQSKDSCYCCIYGETEVNAKIGDIIIKGDIPENDINITDIKARYQAFTISKITLCDTGNIKHIEIEGF